MNYAKLEVTKVLAITVFLVFTLSLKAQYYPERGEWERKRPVECGIDADKINKAVEFADTNERTTPLL